MSRSRGGMWALAVFACAAVACTGARKNVSEDPRPNLDLPPSGRSLALRVAPAVQDQFKATGVGIRPVRVAGWRQTLANGFNNAFGESFTLVPDGEPADLTIEVAEADLRTESAAVSGYYGVVAVRALVRFKVRLLDKSGAVVYRLSGDAQSKGTINNIFHFRQIVKDAAESFWETVGDKYFIKPWPVNPGIPDPAAPAPTPGTTSTSTSTI